MSDDVLSFVAIVPARGGSERIQQKNLQPLGGFPLLTHTVVQALETPGLDHVVVSTDDDQIAVLAARLGATVVHRPPELSGSLASSESALIHALDEVRDSAGIDPTYVVFLQCTSPFRNSGDIRNAMDLMLEKEFDSLVSVCATRRFYWRHDVETQPTPVNYDPMQRPRTQDMCPLYEENGSIYVTRTSLLRETRCRVAGIVGLYTMEHWSAFDIDDPSDLALADWIARQRGMGLQQILPQRVELIVLDSEGLMTEPPPLVGACEDEPLSVSRSDRLGIAILREAGFRMMVLSKEDNDAMRARCRNLALECHSGIDSKGSHLAKLLAREGIRGHNVVYIATDASDLSHLDLVGCSLAIEDAHPDVKVRSHGILRAQEGRGALRVLADALLDRSSTPRVS